MPCLLSVTIFFERKGNIIILRANCHVPTLQEKMPIPSVVIEPASSNEGDDDRDADIISPTTISDNDVIAENQSMKHISPSGGVSGLPDDFLYKVGLIAAIRYEPLKQQEKELHTVSMHFCKKLSTL